MSKELLYYSTNLQSPKVRFKEALLTGQAPDKGLYMPESIPVLDRSMFFRFKQESYANIACTVAYQFLKDEIPASDLQEMVHDAYNFDVPLQNVYKRSHIMRLDRGPTASFKDFAARLMGRWMQYYLKKENRKMLILTATSGDTGSAIANAFYGLDNIEVVILYPTTEVTDRQRKQMTTLHKNISVISLDGKFDDCQALVKMAFSDHDLDHLGLSSANSINIGRLLPQAMYYIYAYSRLAQSENDEIVFSVPSGNFGDLMGGLIAKKMGLPVKKFVIATNSNDEVPKYFNEGFYKTIVPSINCISSAMNVGHPSNMARIISLYGGVMDEKGNIIKQPNLDLLKNDMFAVSVTEEETRKAIKMMYDKHKIIIEPHGAVGWNGLQKYYANVGNDGDLAVCLETAHPAKFPKEINEIIGIDPELPDSLKELDDKEEKMTRLKNNYSDFKKYLLNR